MSTTVSSERQEEFNRDLRLITPLLKGPVDLYHELVLLARTYRYKETRGVVITRRINTHLQEVTVSSSGEVWMKIGNRSLTPNQVQSWLETRRDQFDGSAELYDLFRDVIYVLTDSPTHNPPTIELH